MPLPPRVLDLEGRTVQYKGSAELGSYEVRLEYVCKATAGCNNRTFTLRWAVFQEPAPAPASLPPPPPPPYRPIPPTALVPSSGASELERRAMYAELERGWGTWDHRSSMTWALLPEGFALRLGLVRLSTGAVLQSSDNLIVTTPIHPTVAYPDPDFALRAGLHSLDNRFAELSVTWRGDRGGGQSGGSDATAINVSIAATVDATDSSQLTVVATVNNGHAVNASDYALLVCPLFMFGRTGEVEVEVEVEAGAGVITGTAAGLRKRSVTVLQGRAISAQALPPAARAQLTNYTDGSGDGVYMAIGLGGGGGGGSSDGSDRAVAGGGGGGAIFSTDAGMAVSAAQARTKSYRAAEAATLDKYGPEWGEVKDAVQTSLMWSLMYDPKLSLLAPSYAGVSGLGGDPDTIQVDGGSTEVRQLQHLILLFFYSFGPFLPRFSTPSVMPRVTYPGTLLGAHAHWVLICACNPMPICALRVFRASLSGTSPSCRTCSASTRSSWRCPT